jgi:hypothetical protein
MQEPPGGPPDFDPPVLTSVTPDSGAVVPDLDAPMRFQFDEVISERSGGELDRLIQFSPRVEALDVSWKRDAIEVRPKGGWRQGLIYHVVILPGVTDLQTNRTDEGRTILFSTGDSLPDTRLAGTVLDWEDGRVGQGALVEASLLPDSLVYVTVADSVGTFELRSIPLGDYWVTATIDGNANRSRDPRESFDSVSVSLDASATFAFWAFARDTTGPQIRQVAPADSVTVRIEFTQKLAPGDPDSGAVRVFVLPDTIAVPITLVRTEAAYDSLRAAARQAAGDSAAAVADSLRAAGDTAQAAAAPDTALARVAPAPQPGGAGIAAPGATPASAAADTSAAARLLIQRPTLSAVWYAYVSTPLEAGGRYLVVAIARNVSGAEAESHLPLVVPVPADST